MVVGCYNDFSLKCSKSLWCEIKISNAWSKPFYLNSDVCNERFFYFFLNENQILRCTKFALTLHINFLQTTYTNLNFFFMALNLGFNQNLWEIFLNRYISVICDLLKIICFLKIMYSIYICIYYCWTEIYVRIRQLN